MAISANCVWEFRSTATGSMANGGGFVTGASGTDFSQQDTAEWASLSVTAAGVGTTMLTASAASSMVGNILRIVSGTNATISWYEIKSVVVGTSITVDRNWSSGAVPDGVVNIGGALNTGANENTWATALVAGQKIWLKSGSYSPVQAITTGASGTAASPIQFVGYKTSRGDTCNGADRPVWDTAANTWVTAGSLRFENIIFKGSASPVIAMGSVSQALNCKFINYSTTAGRGAFNFNSGQCMAINCEMVSYRGIAFGMTSTNGYVTGCYIHDSATGINLSNTSSEFIVNNIIESCYTAAIASTTSMAGTTVIVGNTLYGAENKTGIGINFATGSSGAKVLGNLLYGFTTGFNSTDTTSQHKMIEDANAYYNCTTNATNVNLGAQTTIDVDPGFTSVAQLKGTTATTSGNDLTQSGADFSSVVAGRDFVYIASGTGVTAPMQYPITAVSGSTLTLEIAPGTSAVADKVWQITTGRNFTIGKGLKGLGFPRAFPAITNNTSYTDPGALQRQEPQASGSSSGGSSAGFALFG